MALWKIIYFSLNNLDMSHFSNIRFPVWSDIFLSCLPTHSLPVKNHWIRVFWKSYKSWNTVGSVSWPFFIYPFSLAFLQILQPIPQLVSLLLFVNLPSEKQQIHQNIKNSTVTNWNHIELICYATLSNNVNFQLQKPPKIAFASLVIIESGRFLDSHFWKLLGLGLQPRKLTDWAR